jgi:hypothetical protein
MGMEEEYSPKGRMKTGMGNILKGEAMSESIKSIYQINLPKHCSKMN